MSLQATPPIRVLIIVDQAIMSAGLRVIVENESGMEVVGEVKDYRRANAIASRERPDIILFDLDSDMENNLGLLHQLVKRTDGTRVIALTSSHDPSVSHRAVALGTMELVFKEQDCDILIKAIRKVHAGEAWLGRSVVANMLEVMLNPEKSKDLGHEETKAGKLTNREREIIALIARGFSNKQIAAQLFISERTVRNHLLYIFRKLDLSSRLELALYAGRHGIISSNQ